MSEEDLESTPPEVIKIANQAAATTNLKWTREQNVNNYTENVLLAYFSSLSKNLRSVKLWAQYSMVTAQLSLKRNVNIGKYNKLTAFLKRQDEVYKPRKSEVLSKEHIDNFLFNDYQH
ncbi:von willebrand factor a domain-containing protein 8 [Holotrichia oblita]|uniref:von willebrand factor a domain-containing protein 8 n=1 Tax=Holotrichia oblita TaxID=644536 RepID=A0ACB9SZX1_HOLOL|nr:von willebrand factor a domain-containing protein 8 [Holotrichia oblita]